MQVLIDATLIRRPSRGHLFCWLDKAPEALGFDKITPPIVIWSPVHKVLLGEVLLAESHINVHLIPRVHRAFVDIFTCATLDELPVLTLIKELPITDICLKFIPRGLEYLKEEYHEIRVSGNT